MIMKRIEVEIHRTNITVSQFIAAVKQVLKKKGIDYVDIIGMTTKEFKELPVDGLGEMNHSTETSESDFWYTKPCHYQTCYFEKNGVGTNEICEFEFDDDKKGNGYFYFLNVTEDETAEEYTEQTAEEPEKESTDEMTEEAKIKNRLIVLNEIPDTEILAIKYSRINFYKSFITAFTDTTSLKIKFIKEAIPRPPNKSILTIKYLKLFEKR